MRVCLIRHGSTAGNLEHRYVGSTDEELTMDAVLELKENKDRYPQPDCVFVSPLRRCVQTAGLLFPEIEKVVLPDLRECDFGEFEYKNYRELDGDPRYQAWVDSGGTLPFPGGESREAFAARCCAAFLAGCKKAADSGYDCAAFVVHGGTIMAILDRFSSPHKDYFDWQAKNGEGYICGWSARGEDIKDAGKPSPDGAPARKSEVKKSGENCLLTEIRPLPLPALTGIEDQFVMKKNKKLRCGYTTGSCAAAAAKAAAEMLLTGRICKRTELMTPKGILLHLPIEGQKIEYLGKRPPRERNTGYTAVQSDEKRNGKYKEETAGKKSAADQGMNLAAGQKPVRASCAVRKYAGDDPDATDGILICAAAEYITEYSRESETARGSELPPKQNSCSAECAPKGRFAPSSSSQSHPYVIIDGGAGVGRVTKPGLEQPVGAAAINRVPREMITQEVLTVCEEYEYPGGILITISVPEGEEIAKKTFNPHIGILGGISILGTSGIVVPMSEEALIASIRVEMKQKLANGEEYLLITPGNYGADFIRRKELSQSLDAEHSMKCSNYVGETLDMAAELGAKGILFVAHIGKFIKVSGGVMNTHSAHADCRAELMAAQAMRAGASPETVRRLLDTNTTEEAVDILEQAKMLRQTIRETAERIHFHLQKRCRGELETEVILFSNQHGYLGETRGADKMMRKIVLQAARVCEN